MTEGPSPMSKLNRPRHAMELMYSSMGSQTLAHVMQMGKYSNWKEVSNGLLHADSLKVPEEHASRHVSMEKSRQRHKACVSLSRWHFTSAATISSGWDA